MAELITDAELLILGMAVEAMGEVTEAERDVHRLYASSRVLGKLRKRHKLPLVSWSDDVKGATAHIATFSILGQRGFNPASGFDVAIELRNNKAEAWLDEIVEGTAEAEEIVDSSAGVEERGPLVASDELQGWDYPTQALEDCW